MEELFFSAPLGGGRHLCIGTITNNEAALSHEHAAFVDGYGYYLFVADEAAPRQLARVLAKFASEDAAMDAVRSLNGSPAILLQFQAA